MLELLLILAMLAGMARKGRGSSRGRRYSLRSVRFSANSADLTALGINTAITTQVFGNPAGRPYRIMSMTSTWTFENMDEFDGPLIFGYAHGDYTVTEIKECIESGASINVGLKVEQEQSNRLVRIVGAFGSPGVGNIDVTANDGKPIKTRLNWLIPIGKTFNFFVYNDGVAALETAAKSVRINGTGWVKDL